MPQKKIAVFVGSLRKESFNRKMAKALTGLAPESLKLEIIEIGGLPLYDQDVDDNPPAAWAEFRERVMKVDGTPIPVEIDEEWGLDHGAWSVLYHIFPEADIPVVQLSIDRTQPPSFHYEVGKLLAPLRDEGVLLLGCARVA